MLWDNIVCVFYLWLGTIFQASYYVFLMGMFFDLTVKKDYTGYIVSETGIFTGVVYIILVLLFWNNQMK